MVTFSQFSVYLYVNTIFYEKMSLTKFNIITRSALWNSYKNTCFYCSKILDWDDIHIDHIIPESLALNIEEFDKLKLEFDLDEKFNVNELYNLVPTHSKCNLRKNDELFPKRTILYYLGLTNKNLLKIKQEINKLEKRKIKGQIISKVQTALASNLINTEELQTIINSDKQHNWSTQEIKLPLGVEFIDEIYDLFYIDMDVSPLIDKKLLIGGGEYDYLSLTNDYNAKIKVSTLREWKQAISQGFYPLSNADIKTSANFTFFDELINALRSAKMPKVSFISEPWVGINNIDLLSPTILQGHGKDFIKYIKQGLSIGDLVRKGVVKTNESEISTISFEFDGMEVSLIEQFRADFNNNGIEDIFVCGWTRAIGGSLGYGFTSFLTRISNQHLIEQSYSL